MKLSIGSTVNMTPAPNGVWSAVFQLAPDSDIELCPVIGWATVVVAHLKDGTVSTEVKPAFVWGDMVWTENELREHSPELTAFDIRRLSDHIPA
ncbi:hypothetical protein ACFWP7_13220 [Streptomyces sp. NPDC058470]|uniref:hypothetical protein n=1 Tax=Streptomyces sp. NPDC058470 TaxID=3346515 RepID=UPI0036495BA5